MEDKHIIIILLCVIIALLVIGLVMVSPMFNKEDCNLAISNTEINFGEDLTVTLTDSYGNPISNETIFVKLTEDDGTLTEEDIKTDSNGQAKIKIEETGGYTVSCNFRGNDKFNSVSTSENITVNAASTTTSSSSQVSSGNQYDINNLPPSNDPYPETNRFYIDENHVRQEYEDHYYSIVDLRTGERHGAYF